jgi:curved DNA-binding protein CbpA
MNISINSKNLSAKLTKDEIFVLNTIIDKIDFISLKKIIANNMNEEVLVSNLKSLYEKKVINIDNPSLLNIESFTKKEGSTYLYTNTNISEQIENIYKKIQEKRNYYEILGVTPKSSLKEIKFMYYKFSKRYHPDIVKKYNLPLEIQKQVGVVMLEISNILNVLKVPSKRAEYDKSLDIFKNKVTTMVNKNPNSINIEKSKEYASLANNEYYAGKLEKSLQLIKLSLSYNPHNSKALALKSDIEVLLNKNKIASKLKNIDSLIGLADYYEAFQEINDLIIENGDQKKFLFKKIEILEKMGFHKNKNKIISLLQDIIAKEKDEIKARELLIEYLKMADEKSMLKEEAEKLLKIDSKNKVAKKYIKGKLWNMF